MGSLAAIYRHPVKSLGEEALSSVTLTTGQPLPWDRCWAIAHDRSDFNAVEPDWVKPQNFVIQSMCPELAQIKCAFDEESGALTMSHPVAGSVTSKPGKDDRLSAWIGPIAGASGPGPYRLANVPGQALHDFPDTHISIGNLASLRALEEMAGRKLAHIRFRMNLWIDGFAPWEELDWADSEITIAATRLRVIDRVKRCNATNADPETGTRNTDIPRLLHGRFGHMDFGLYAEVLNGGNVAVGHQASA
ncbi:MAG: MOSC N-terminal beta barrel domain-containing protein [Pseudomonadota bacterium]